MFVVCVAAGCLYLGGLRVSAPKAPPDTPLTAGTVQGGFLVAALAAETRLDVLKNDYDPLGRQVVVNAVFPSNARAAVRYTPDAVWYTPPLGFAGTDRFSYQVLALGGTKIATAPVTVTVVAPPVANAGQDRVLWKSRWWGSVGVTLDGTKSTSAVKITRYVWTGVNGAPDPADWSRPTVYLKRGVWTFRLVCTDSLGQSSAPDTVIITVR
jgi:hypothetical protein